MIKWNLAFILLFFSCTNSNHLPLMEEVANFKKENHLAQAKNVMIATQGGFSTEAGLNMIKAGGNIVDAFAAISFVISVERPQSTGIGGGGFLLFHSAKENKTYSFDFREVAPLNSHSKIFLDDSGNEVKGKSLVGIFAAGTPGLVKGVINFHKKFGKLPLSKVMEDAIRLARDGFTVYPELEKALKYSKSSLAKFPSSKKIFFKGNEVLKTGDKLVQLDLAKTLQRISQTEGKDFYEGETAKKIIETSKQYQGLLTLNDLKSYEVKERAPVSGDFRGFQIKSMGPPSSGGVHILQILNILENFDLKKDGVMHPRTVHRVASAMEMAFADRAKYLGDADFVKVPVKGIISKAYGKELAAKIKIEAFKKNEVSAGNPMQHEPDHTTHFSIMDKEGNAIVSTQTINGYFGSALVAEGTGIVLNNEMDDFSTKPGAMNLFGAVGSKQNLVEPGKRPLSSMSPTIVFKDGKPIMAVGTPSGTRILTCVMQTILNRLEFQLDPYTSVAGTRYHHQWRPHYIRFDKNGLNSNLQKALEKMGHKVERRNLGCRVQSVFNEGGALIGVSDPRGEGRSQGL